MSRSQGIGRDADHQQRYAELHQVPLVLSGRRGQRRDWLQHPHYSQGFPPVFTPDLFTIQRVLVG
jgi:hypothetical protein